MNKLKSFCFISVAWVIISFVFGCAVRPSTQSIEIKKDKGIGIQITKDPKDQENPAISGDRIVWQDVRNGNWDIYMYDLPTKEEIQITSNPADQINPSISGDIIVWEDYAKSEKRPNICMFDLTKNKIESVNPTGASQKYPAVSGDRIIWVEESEIKGKLQDEIKLYMYDLTTNKKSEIFSFLEPFPSLIHHKEHFDPPAISGGLAVWHFYKGINVDDHEVLVFNLVTEERISLGPGYYPAIFENKVGWLDDRDSPPGPYLKVYDLENKTTTLISPIPYMLLKSVRVFKDASPLDDAIVLRDIDPPAIAGNLVVFTHDRAVYTNDPSIKRIYIYDLENKKETQITFTPSDDPAISGNRIVWADYRNKNWDIYMYDLAEVKKIK